MDVLEMLPSEERLSNHDEEWGSIEEVAFKLKGDEAESSSEFDEEYEKNDTLHCCLPWHLLSIFIEIGWSGCFLDFYKGGEGLTTTVDNLDNSMAGVGTTGNNHGVTSDAPKTSRAMISGLDRESVGHLVSARAE
ncbi:hypothetical protein CJ030_MR7G016941 [Morella rubra]|uniref:Uncharacterized protein n=1 Tax=Morella rubra TaxID=262757 RepID=A0A6A1V068_9ROSI|nr:hypothetical protein CJ030_MR7G016941 [Morella rubra]